MTYSAQGIITKKFPVAEKSPDFKIQLLELQVVSNFENQYPVFQFGSKLFERLTYFEEGQEVLINFSINSRKGVVFNNLIAFSINSVLK